MSTGKKHVYCLVRLVLLTALFLTGCGQLEIEKRAFPLALAITPAEAEGMYEFSFFFEEMESSGGSLYHKEDTVVTAGGYPQAFTLFGRAQAAQLDDSHMQVILLSEALLRDADFLESFYQYFVKEHHFSWNTMVYLMDEQSITPEKLKKSTADRPGTYLRDMAQSDEQEKTASVPTLGDLYKEWNNREKILLLPVLSKGAPPSVSHYRLLIQGEPGDTLSMDAARLLQLLRGDLKKMQLELSDGTIVCMEHIRLRRTYASEAAVWQVAICADFKAENRIQQSASERRQLVRTSERLLEKQSETVRQWAPVTVADGQLVLPEYAFHLSLR